MGTHNLDPADVERVPWGDLEIVFHADASLYDGRFANSGWLQECPRPMTKITWDNAAVMAPATAKALGVEFESVVTLKFRDRPPLQLPVYVLPGHAPGSISVALGYGRTAAGRAAAAAAESSSAGKTRARKGKARKKSSGEVDGSWGQRKYFPGILWIWG